VEKMVKEKKTKRKKGYVVESLEESPVFENIFIPEG